MVELSVGKTPFEDRAYGCILGAFVGDALGTTLEFATGIVSDADAMEAMGMVGGGPFKLAPGQVTDDSELAMM